jgi:hypothetical protein
VSRSVFLPIYACVACWHQHSDGTIEVGLLLSDDERSQLTSIARSRSISAARVTRARIVLVATGGEPNCGGSPQAVDQETRIAEYLAEVQRKAGRLSLFAGTFAMSSRALANLSLLRHHSAFRHVSSDSISALWSSTQNR